jgi:hypothetical protein
MSLRLINEKTPLFNLYSSSPPAVRLAVLWGFVSLWLNSYKISTMLKMKKTEDSLYENARSSPLCVSGKHYILFRRKFYPKDIMGVREIS